MGLGDFSTSGGGSSGGGGGGLGGFSTSGNKDKKKKSNVQRGLGILSQGAKNIGGGAVNLLGAPQQVIFGLAHSVKGIPGMGGSMADLTGGLKHAAVELGTLGQARGDWDFAQTLGTFKGTPKGTQAPTPKKLGFGINTLGTILLDPAAALAVGKGAQAGKGVTKLAKLTGQTEKAVSQGIRTGKLADEAFSVAKGSPVRQMLEKEISKDILTNSPKANRLIAAGKTEKATKFAEKQAGKIGKQTARRGEGGVNLFLPGTEKSINIAKAGTVTAPFRGATNLAGKTAIGAKIIEGAQEAFIPGKELAGRVGDAASEKIRRLGQVRGNRSVQALDEMKSEIRNAVEASGGVTAAQDSALLKAIESDTVADFLAKSENTRLAPLAEVLVRNRDHIEEIQKAAGLIGRQPGDINALLRHLDKVSAKATKFRGHATDAAGRAKVAGANARKARTEAERIAKEGARKGESKANYKARLKAAQKKADRAEAAAKADFVAEAQEDIAASATRSNVNTMDDADRALYEASSSTPWTDQAKDQFLQDAGIPPTFNRANLADQVWHNTIDVPDPVTGGVHYTKHNILSLDASGNPVGRLTFNSWDNGEISAIDVMVDPAARRQGHATKMYQKAKDEGFDLEPFSGQGQSYLPMGAEFAAGRRAKAAAEVIDWSDPKMVRTIERYEAKIAELDTTVKELNEAKKAAQKLASGAERGSKNAAADAARLNAKAKRWEVKVKQLKDDIADLEASNRGIRENYMRRLPSADLLKATKSKRLNRIFAGKGSLSGALDQAATQARTILPDMPANTVNELKIGYDAAKAAGQDPIAALKLLAQDAEVAKFLPEDTQNADALLKQFAQIADSLPEGAKFYEETAMGSLLTRAAEAHRAVEGVEYLKGVKALSDEADAPFLLDADGLDAVFNGKLPEDWVEMHLPGNQGTMYAPVEVAREMNRVVNFANADDFTSKFGKAMDTWINFWKAHATTGLLGALPFVARNARSNVFLMMSDGMTPVDVAKYMREAKALEDKLIEVMGSKRIGNKFVGKYADEVARDGVDAVLQRVLKPYEYDLYRAMQDEGILTSGFFDHEFQETLSQTLAKVGAEKAPRTKAQTLKAGASAVVGGRTGLTKAGRELNQTVERNARMASFLFNVDRYGDVKEAAQATKKVLFDYSDLTEAERRIFKRIIPFYTFMRKNLPHQLETMVQHPLRISVPEKISETVSGGAPDEMPDYQEAGGYRKVNPLVPLLGGQTSAPDRPFYAALETLSPLLLAAQGKGAQAARAAANIPGGPQIGALNAIAEAGVGRDMFTGNRIQSAGGAGDFVRRLVASQLPSAQRIPRVEAPVPGTGVRVNPAQAVSGKTAQPLTNELLKFLTGIRVTDPDFESPSKTKEPQKQTGKSGSRSSGKGGGLGSFSTKR